MEPDSSRPEDSILLTTQQLGVAPADPSHPSIDTSVENPADSVDEIERKRKESNDIDLVNNNAASASAESDSRSSFRVATASKGVNGPAERPSRDTPSDVAKAGVLEAQGSQLQQMMTSRSPEIQSFEVNGLRTESAQAEMVDEPTEEPEEEWFLKSIPWPPLPPLPSSSRSSTLFSQGPITQIITQSMNGPCSLMAICNILILRSDISIPPSRSSVTYSYLSNLVADFLLRANTNPATTKSNLSTTQNTDTPNLASALSILPTTRYGLDLNPCFGSITAFVSSASSSNKGSSNQTLTGELSLFQLTQISLVHGWLLTPSDGELYDLLVANQNSNGGGGQDYDSALLRIIEGEEIEGPDIPEVGDMDDILRSKTIQDTIERRSKWTALEKKKVEQGRTISEFIRSSPTQLTYPGLFQLSSELKPSSLSALFHNSHLTVVYRRPPIPDTLPSTLSISSQAEQKLPTLFTLVTDSTFLNERLVVWESLEDVDGQSSRYFDGSLTECDFTGPGDWVGGRPASIRRTTSEAYPPCTSLTDNVEAGKNDYALAQQLQLEEENRFDRLQSDREGSRVGRSGSTLASDNSLPSTMPSRPSTTPVDQGRQSREPRDLSRDDRNSRKKKQDGCSIS